MAFIKLDQVLKELRKDVPEEQSTPKRENSYSERPKNSTTVGRELFDFLNLIKEWPMIVGPKLAEHTIPLKNLRGTLVIVVGHSIFAEQLKFMEEELKNKIYVHFPNLKTSIKKISFLSDSAQFKRQQQVKERHASATKEKSLSNSKPHPLSPEYKKLEKEAYQNMKEISDIDDKEVKEMLISLYLQTKK